MNSSCLPGCAHMNAKYARSVAELLPVVAGHLAQQRALAVHHLVVRRSAGTNCSENAYISENVISLWWYCR